MRILVLTLVFMSCFLTMSMVSAERVLEGRFDIPRGMKGEIKITEGHIIRKLTHVTIEFLADPSTHCHISAKGYIGRSEVSEKYDLSIGEEDVLSIGNRSYFSIICHKNHLIIIMRFAQQMFLPKIPI